MRESRQHTIGDYTYTIQQLGAKEGRIVLARVLRVIAGAAGAAQSSDDALEAAGAGIAKLVEGLSDAELTFLCDTFARATMVGRAGTMDAIRLSDGVTFDEHFAGRYGEMLRWLWASLETNYASFLSDMGLNAETLANLQQGVKTAMGLNKASPTPPSGASSSPASAG